jgi:hypothetical protein
VQPLQSPSRRAGDVPAIGQSHEESAGEKIGRFFRRAMDRLAGNEPEWRREETGRPAGSRRGEWTPVSPSLRIPPGSGASQQRRPEPQRRLTGRDDEGFSGNRSYGGQGSASGPFLRRPGESSQAGRSDLGGDRRLDPYERNPDSQAWGDEDRSRRLARERDSWSEATSETRGSEPTGGTRSQAAERAWQRNRWRVT